MAEVDGKKYANLQDAIENVGNGQTITILKDIPNAAGISVPSKRISQLILVDILILWLDLAQALQEQNERFQLLRSTIP